MSLFEPIGEKSRKDLALELFAQYYPGDLIAYSDLSEAVGTSNRTAVQAAVRDASKSFLKSCGHALEAVRGEGYRIVEPDGHARLSDKRRERSSRELSKAYDIVAYADESEMTPDARRMTEGLRAVVSAQMDFNRRMDARLRSAEKATEAVVVKTDRTEAEVAELRARLERLESVA